MNQRFQFLFIPETFKKENQEIMSETEEMVEGIMNIMMGIEEEMVEKEEAENKEMIEGIEGEVIETTDNPKRNLCMWIKSQGKNQTTKKYCNSG